MLPLNSGFRHFFGHSNEPADFNTKTTLDLTSTASKVVFRGSSARIYIFGQAKYRNAYTKSHMAQSLRPGCHAYTVATRVNRAVLPMLRKMDGQSGPSSRFQIHQSSNELHPQDEVSQYGGKPLIRHPPAGRCLSTSGTAGWLLRYAGKNN
jgi:hypothetical protein